MRSRTVREGSVGLLILLGLGLFAGLALWLRGLNVGQRSYNAVIEFPRVNGMQEGAPVRFRGVTVGNISAIRPGPNGVEVYVEFASADLIIPRDVVVEANQSGLISEVSIDITPERQLPTGEVAAKPLDPNCDRTLIVCDGSRLSGQIGISVDELIRFSTRFASVYSEPEVYANLNEAVKNTSIAAAGVAQLTRELSGLTKATQQQLNNFSTTANSVERAVDQISASTEKTSAQFGATADQIRLTAAQANRLITNLDTLVTTNRSALVTALNNLNQTSEQLRTTVDTLSPTLNRVTQGELLQNLETLSANAAQASANLRDVTNALSTPTNLLVLQQTLDSARVTFQNAQKITSDLDELTGDPAFRQNLRELIDGLSGLVSSTQQLQQEVQVAETLDSLTTAVNKPRTGNKSTGLNPAIPEIPSLDSAKSAPTGKRSKPATAPAKNSQENGEPTTRNLLPQWLLQLKASSGNEHNSRLNFKP